MSGEPQEDTKPNMDDKKPAGGDTITLRVKDQVGFRTNGSMADNL